MEQTASIARAQRVIGHSFSDPDLIVTGLTHSSIAGSRIESNERLEFLGDAVLGSVICDELYQRYPKWLEGDLTKVKSMVVSRRVCAKIADDTGLTDLLILGNGIEGQGALPMSLRAAVYEAIIGAIYLDAGYEAARKFIVRTAASEVEASAESENHDNHKSSLQQYVQRTMGATPQYEALDEQGPDHSKCFEVCVVINHQRFPSAWGPCKKEAEQKAAQRALEILRGDVGPSSIGCDD